MSLVNSADSAEAGLAVAKLRKINQGLRVGLRDATAGWREAVVLCRGVEKKCEELYGEVEELKRQRSVQRSKEADLLDRIQGMEKVGEVRVGGEWGGQLEEERSGDICPPHTTPLTTQFESPRASEPLT